MDKLINKSVSKGKWTLKYSQYIDDYGLKADSYTYRETKENGDYVNYPGVTPMRAQDYSKNTTIDLCNEPTEEEMREDLEDFIAEKIASEVK